MKIVVKSTSASKNVYRVNEDVAEDLNIVSSKLDNIPEHSKSLGKILKSLDKLLSKESSSEEKIRKVLEESIDAADVLSAESAEILNMLRDVSENM